MRVALRRIALAVFAIALALVPILTPSTGEFWITQANYIGLYTLVEIGRASCRERV